jgi:hypothetical protein
VGKTRNNKTGGIENSECQSTYGTPIKDEIGEHKTSETDGNYNEAVNSRAPLVSFNDSFSFASPHFTG